MALDKFQPYLFVSAGEQSNKYLTPVISPEGIASFQAQRAQQLTKLLVQIDSVQDLNGQANPYPAGGGKNLIPYPYNNQSGTYNGITVTVNDDGTLVLNGTATASVYFNLVDNNSGIPMTAGSYILHKPTTGDTGSSVRLTVVKNGSYWDTASTGNASLTLSEDANVSFYVNVGNGTTLSNVKVYPMFEKGTTASDWSPYSNICPISGRTGLTVTVQSGETQNEYPVTWETEAGTVYGGTLDVVSGVLTVKYGYVDLGTLDWAPYSDASRHIFRALPPTPSPKVPDWSAPINAISSQYTAMAYSPLSANDNGKFAIGNNRLVIIDHRYSTNAEFQSAMDGVQMVYEIDTPQTYQLTPTEVKTLAGYNQIYSDAGPVIDIKF